MTKKTDKVNELEAKVNELDAQLKRAVADYQNLEKRITEGRSELTSFVAGELVNKLLQVLDHLEQATNGATEAEKESGWFKGVELAVKQFKDVLKLEGLEEIQDVGEFNPSLHEAVDVRDMPPSLDSSGIHKDNMILEVIRKGYNLNGKVLRPAQVVVGRSPDNHPERPEGAEG
ncbi:nucleotide exchange factor GrpE [Candidatus Daviesbacteria bacterium RIFCSPHIGHO2_12_FULL_37_11]|uniref:Protein GrpE n=1 Tax=Candidatus Daviesbacteria bacterium RIFCSPHIGHO2_12_FULL_37_11 TaxID=1797777 RepID=A0A1F5KD70_9BACT|nr:MAG: nucleotide exchange factor GrpE [Candidatus Daviesbacteria bacterium RIFCSPHIGHO2_01_FULL_37_27]OGE38740.1 MAG: nucleotide exchange factor GrpE [Candidatus Daviesbacteria bacterium RIFCSPHIGHO2_12_FULL_37_11]OGE45829.1 MAG: nucleotide exchange factor GrpE [Candidatus Daviesbacteria bacterium RIFCSPLOWO2_01_FULL_37_10]